MKCLVALSFFLLSSVIFAVPYSSSGKSPLATVGVSFGDGLLSVSSFGYPNAVFFNPANLDKVGGAVLGAGVVRGAGGVYFANAVLSKHFRSWTLGLGVSWMNSGSIPLYNDDSAFPARFSSENDVWVRLGAGFNMGKMIYSDEDLIIHSWLTNLRLGFALGFSMRELPISPEEDESINSFDVGGGVSYKFTDLFSVLDVLLSAGIREFNIASDESEVMTVKGMGMLFSAVLDFNKWGFHPYLGIAMMPFGSEDHEADGGIGSVGLGFNLSDSIKVKMSVGGGDYGMQLTVGATIKYKSYDIGVSSFVKNLGTGVSVSFTSLLSSDVYELPEDVKEFNKGLDEFYKRNYRLAKRHFELAVSINPDNQLAREYLERVKKLLVKGELLSEEEKKQIETFLRKAKNYEKQGDYLKAIEEYQKVLDKNPFHEEALDRISELKDELVDTAKKHYEKGLAYYEKDKKEEAEREFKEALKVYPEFTPALDMLDRIRREKQLEIAKKLNEEARRKVIDAMINKGLFYRGNFEYEKALEVFRNVLTLDPDNKRAKDLIEETTKEFREFRSRELSKSKSIASYKEGQKALEEKDYVKAISKFREAVKYWPQNEDAKKSLGSTYKKWTSILKGMFDKGMNFYKQGDRRSAIAEWEKIVEADKNHPISSDAQRMIEKVSVELKEEVKQHIVLGKQLRDSGNLYKALLEFKQAVNIDPKNEEAVKLLDETSRQFEAVARGMYSEGETLFKQGRYPEALDKFESLLSVLPQNHELYNPTKGYISKIENLVKTQRNKMLAGEKMRLAMSYFKNEDYEMASKLFDEVVKLDPSNRQALKYKKICSQKLKEFSNRQKLSKMIMAGIKLYRKKKFDEAIAQWKKAKKLASSIGEDTSMLDAYISNARRMKVISTDKYYRSAVAAMKKGNYLKAKELLEKTLVVNPDLEDAKVKLKEVARKVKERGFELVNSAKSYFKAGNYDKALETAKLALKYLPDDETASIVRSDSETALKLIKEVEDKRLKKDFSGAMEKLSELLALNPDDRNAKKMMDDIIYESAQMKGKWLADARKLLKKDRIREALSRLNAVLKIDPNNPTAKKLFSEAQAKKMVILDESYSRGKRYLMAKNYKMAVSELSKVVELEPRYKDARELLFKAKTAYLKITSKERAKKQKLISKYLMRGVTLYRKGKLREAIAEWRKVLRIDPNNEKAKRYIERAKFGMRG